MCDACTLCRIVDKIDEYEQRDSAKLDTFFTLLDDVVKEKGIRDVRRHAAAARYINANFVENDSGPMAALTHVSPQDVFVHCMEHVRNLESVKCNSQMLYFKRLRDGLRVLDPADVKALVHLRGLGSVIRSME